MKGPSTKAFNLAIPESAIKETRSQEKAINGKSLLRFEDLKSLNPSIQNPQSEIRNPKFLNSFRYLCIGEITSRI